MHARNVLLPAIATLAVSAALAGSTVAAFAAQASPQPRPSPIAARPTPARPTTPAPSPTFDGIVRGPDGKPIEKALVIAMAMGPRPGETTRSTRTDQRGRFRLEVTGRVKHRVRAEATGLAGRTLEGVMPGTPLTIDLARGGTIEGVVRDGESGQPAAGIRVDTRDGGAIGLPGDPTVGRIEAVTDGEGRFTLTGLGPGRHLVKARGRGRGYASRNGVPLGARVEMLLQPAATLFGVITGPDGKPIAGAIVTPLAMRSAQGPRSERSDEQGRYEVNGLGAGLYDVAVRAPGLAPGAIPDVVVEKRGDVRVDVTLQPGARVTGRLVGANDKPLPGRVTVGEIEGHPAPYVLADLLLAEAGADGRFVIEAVPVGAHALGASSPGLAARRVELEVSALQRAVDMGDIRMEAGLVIRGRVRTRAGEPVANATIQGYGQHSRTGASAQASTDADGAFAMGGLEPLTYRLSTSAPGFGATRIEAEPGGDAVELVLDAAGGIAGTVQDERGRPIETFDVIARPVAEDGPSPSKQFTTEDGRFVLENVPAGAYAVTVRAPERASASVSAKVAAGGPTDVGTVKLGPGASIRGTVVDTGGAFVGGARITVTKWVRESFTTTFDGEPEIMSDRSGAFEAKGVEAGSYEVTASHPAYARSLPVAAVVEAGRPAPELRLVLSEGGRIEGTYRRRDGAPIPASFVVATPIREEAWNGGPLVPVQPDGSFTIEHVPAGRVRVTTMTSAGRGQYRSAQARDVVVGDGETARLDIVSREILMAGRVVRAGGPAAGLRLEAQQGNDMTTFSSRGQTAPYAPAGPERMGAVTREDGTFEMIVDEPGSLRMTVWSQDQRFRFPVRTIEVPDADSFSVELSFDGVAVSGIVVDKDTDAPIPYATVNASMLRPPQHPGATATAGPDGRFQLELVPGEYHFLGMSRDSGHSYDSVKVEVGPSGVTDVRVPLPRALRITGRALDPTGRPVAATRLLASNYPANSVGHGETLADGSFEIRGIKNVDHRLTAWSDAGFFAIQPSVGAGTTELALRMLPAGRVAVQVVTADGQPVAGVSPSVGNIDGAPNMSSLGACRAPTNPQGRTELLTPAGRLMISASVGTLGGYASIDVGPGETVSARIVVEEPPAR